MTAPLVLLTAFGSFEKVDDNPTAHVAQALRSSPPEGVDLRAHVLPVSFLRAPATLDEALADLSPRVPDLLLGLGVDARGQGFRLEVQAHGHLAGEKRVDVDGVVASRATHDLGHGADAPRRTGIDVGDLAAQLEALGHPRAGLSENAGGYVCERIYHHLLLRGDELARPALFVHVPPAEVAPVPEQTAFVGALIQRLVGS